MMARNRKAPTTQGVRQLKNAGVDYVEHLYDYEPQGGTGSVAAALNVDEHLVVKTLVMETDSGAPLLVLMHGDRSVSTKDLARALDTKRVVPCSPETAHRLTGYFVGGISPFGTRQSLPVYAEGSIFSLPRIYINGGHRGFIVEMSSGELRRVLDPTVVAVATH
jgi:Cys-tRNA(Pro) deacylase